MAEFRLGRIRFVWKDAWSASTTYYVDDVIRYGGKVYICVEGHNADADFYTDLNAVPSKWNLMSDGQTWRGDWDVDTFYAIGDIVLYGGITYICNTPHTSNSDSSLSLEADSGKWDTFAESFIWQGNWAVNTQYKINDVVAYGGQTYIARTTHESALTDASAVDGLAEDAGKWELINPGIIFRNTWSNATTKYRINDVVKYGAGLWICTAAHVPSSLFETDVAKWSQFVEGFEFEDDWSNSTVYQPGDIVRYGGNQYVAKTNHSGSNPLTGTTDWDLFAEGFRYSNDWAINTSYKIGNVVRVNGYTYTATTDSPSVTDTATATSATGNVITVSDTSNMVVNMAIQFGGTSFGDINTGATYYIESIPSGTTLTVSSLPGGTAKTLANDTGTMTVTAAPHPTNTSYWQRLTSGILWRGEWADDAEYEVGDAVRYGANAYICISRHRAEGDDGSSIGEQGGGVANTRPDQDTAGTYWNTVAIGNEADVLTTRGDLVYYGGSGPTRLPIGTEGQILRVSSGGLPEWASLGKVDNVYYVSPNGTDQPAPVSGLTLDKPWASIRYACEQIEKGVRYPNARTLLELNRTFLQREVTEYIQWQIANAVGGSIWDGFDYEDYKCERDVGWTIDALIYDLTHGGNVKTRGVANSLVGAITEDSPGAYPGLSVEGDQSIAAYNYLLTIIGNVLAQTAPSVNYQTTNGDNSTRVVTQYFDGTTEAETNALTQITSLLTIVTNAIEDGDASRVPARRVEESVVQIKTGRYREVLPIIVPEGVSLLGDEIRSTNAGPAGSLVDTSDVYYSLGTLERLASVIPDVIQGNDVTESAGNTETQSAVWPFGESAEATDATTLINMIKHNADWRVRTMASADITDPVAYNTSYLVGYGDARKSVEYNRKYLKEEVIAYITANYPNLKYSKTKCKQDVDSILDAVYYDLTYGGFAESINAGLAYYAGRTGARQVSASEVTATVAALTFLKSRLNSVTSSATVSSLQSDIPQWKGTAASAAGTTAVQTMLAIIIEIFQDDPTATSYINKTVTTIASNVITTAETHGLQIGDKVIARETGNGFGEGTTYYVLTVPSTTQFTLSLSYGGSTASFTNGSGLSIDIDVYNLPTSTNGVSSTTALITAAETLDAARETIITNMTTYIGTNYPSLTYDSDKCERDARLILEAAMFDFMFSGNWRTIKAGRAYLRAQSENLYDLGQKTATRAAFTYLKDQAKSNVGGNATVQARLETLFGIVDALIFSGTTEGTNCATAERNADYAVLQLERNRDYIVAEATAYIGATYKGTVSATSATNDVITVDDTSWLDRNVAISFAENIGNIINGTTYYVYEVISDTEFSIAETRNATATFTLADQTKNVTVSLVYSSASCERDVNRYIDAIKYDLKYPGNYKSFYAARYYANGVIGSLEEDMYYLRNTTGVRNQTLDGLSGDLLPENGYGTSRVSAGAYCSLDPGWGPDDYRTWIITRSPYVQGVSTFGTAAIGQKIDGALHNGGNDSIVSNDFTQVISDGIGAWITNNGRAELVSVFTYYSHIGYLAEAGGRIRGTNGNNSYGDFGSVAEGFDAEETPGSAVVDNKGGFNAVIGSVVTDGDEIYGFEFDHAGDDYSEVGYTITGGGISVSLEANEFRDDAIKTVRLLDLGDDSSGQLGGEGYLTAANTAQGGTTTSITLAAVDQNISSAFIGMKVFVDGGKGAGQYGIINTYNAGTKLANVVRESDGVAGWDHVVPGTTIVAPDASSTYIVEPRVTIPGPGFSSENVTLPSGQYTDAVFGYTTGTYLAQSGTYAGSGSGATFDVVRNGWKYIVTKATGGEGYSRLETITIPGTVLDGTSPTNDITITITAINSTTGELLDFEHVGDGVGGNYILGGGTNIMAYSTNGGDTWSTTAVTGTFNDVAYGLLDDGSSDQKIPRFVAIDNGTSNAIWSADGITWNTGSLPSSTSWQSVSFGGGKFLAVSSSGDVAISNDGEVWDITSTLNGTGAVLTEYGQGRWVAIASGDTNAIEYSDDGGSTWTQANMPANVTWSGLAFGNNIWVAVASDSNTGAVSIDGETWTATTVGSPDSTDPAGYRKVKYGQGLFIATMALGTIDGGTPTQYTNIAKTQNGIYWEHEGVVAGPNALAHTGFNAITFGNHNRTGYWLLAEFSSGTRGAKIRTGAQAKARAFVSQEQIFVIRLTEPGSGYDSAPSITITDPNNLYELPTQTRLGKGCLATPNFINRGQEYTSANAEVNTTVSDGYADFFQFGSYVYVKRLSSRPVAGSNVVFGHLPNRTFKLVNVLTFLGENDGSYTAYFQVSPQLERYESPDNEETITTRIRYSQVRLTGHDFLDIGTGNFTESNYPGTPTQDPIPANETVENNGGRVFFTSTDQDGNFRVGGLFNVEQSTGIATLNADAFNIAGLQELQLGEVTLGGGSASITEFSTDPFFTADSDSVVPTQRAIKAYIASQIGGGGASLNVNSVTAGSIFVNTNQIRTVDGSIINMRGKFNFKGSVTGYPLAWNYFLN